MHVLLEQKGAAQWHFACTNLYREMCGNCTNSTPVWPKRICTGEVHSGLHPVSVAPSGIDLHLLLIDIPEALEHRCRINNSMTQKLRTRKKRGKSRILMDWINMHFWATDVRTDTIIWRETDTVFAMDHILYTVVRELIQGWSRSKGVCMAVIKTSSPEYPLLSSPVIFIITK